MVYGFTIKIESEAVVIYLICMLIFPSQLDYGKNTTFDGCS